MADTDDLKADEHPLAESLNRKTREILSAWRDHPRPTWYFGGLVRGLLEEAGLSAVDNEGVALIARGRELDPRRICMSIQDFMEHRLVSQAEGAELQKVYSDPSFSHITATYFAAWGKRSS